VDIDNATELRAMQDAGRRAFADGRTRHAPRGLLLSEGRAWYDGYDDASMAAFTARQMAKPFDDRNFE
jgi:hypothetical protein